MTFEISLVEELINTNFLLMDDGYLFTINLRFTFSMTTNVLLTKFSLIHDQYIAYFISN